jgi:hypothetical protein
MSEPRFKQTEILEQRLAQKLYAFGNWQATPPGVHRERLLRRAGQCELLQPHRH